MGGGLTDWHRQNRKRALQKNKEQRLAARDAKVKETKTVSSVKQEIRTLERQYKDQDTRPHAVKSKLDRLNKELKLVQQQQEQENEQKTGGAPRSISQQQQQQQHSNRISSHPKQPPSKTQRDNKPAALAPNRKSEPLLSVQRPKRYGKAVTDVWAASAEEELEGLDNNDDTFAEAEAKGSSSSKKRPKPQQHAKNSGNNGKASTVVAKEEQWFYKDQAGQVQGPFTTLQMSQWIGANFFPPTTLMRSSTSASWNALQSTPLLRDWISSRNDDNSNSNNNQQNHKNSVEATEETEKATMQEEPMAAAAAVEDSELPESTNEHKPDSVEQRIAALRAKHVEENDQQKQLPEEVGPLPSPQPPGDYLADATSGANLQEATMASIDYPVHFEDDNGDTMQDDGGGDMAFVPYPVHENDNEEEGADQYEYPVSGSLDQDGIVDDEGYPAVSDEYPVSGEYPVSDPYPGQEEVDGVEEDQNQPKKKARIDDAEVVALLPSHVRRKT